MVEVAPEDGQPFYLDNEAFDHEDRDMRHKAGTGWAKVTIGRGGPHWLHYSVPVEEVLA